MKKIKTELTGPRIYAVIYSDMFDTRGSVTHTTRLGQTELMSLKQFIDTYPICRTPFEYDTLVNQFVVPPGGKAYVIVYLEHKVEIPDPRPYLEDRLS